MPREDSAPHLENHPCQEPEQASNAVPSLVVGRDADIDIPHGGVSITEGNGGDVAQSRLLDWLQIVTQQFGHHHRLLHVPPNAYLRSFKWKFISPGDQSLGR